MKQPRKIYWKDEVRELLEQARKDMRVKIAGHIRGNPILRDLIARGAYDKETIEMCALVAEDTIADSHWPGCPENRKK